MKLNTGSYFGLWWLQGKETQKINGTLYFKEDGSCLLSTIDRFEIASSLTDFHRYSLVLGIASSMDDGKDYSFKLLNVYQDKRQTQVLTKNRFSIEYLLIGEVNTKEQGEHFNYLMITNPALSHWSQITGLDYENLFAKDRNYEFNFTYRQPSSITLFKNDDVEVYFFVRANTTFSQNREVTLKETPFINIKFNRAITFEDCLQFKLKIERLFTILWKEPVIFTEIELKSLEGVDFKVYGKNLQEQRLNHPDRNFQSFIDNSQKILNNWLKISEELGLLVNTFFSAYTSKQMYIDDKFLAYCFSLELYHRIRYRSKEPLSKANATMYFKTLDQVKGDVKSCLESFLNKERDINFSTRLKELLQEKITLIPIDQIESFSRKVAKTRNYLVHLDVSLEDDIFQKEDFIGVNDKLTILMLNEFKAELFKEV